MIKAEKLTKDYGPIRAVDQIEFEVRQGDILGFLGPNGAGKSTTMKMVTGFLPPTSGTASIGGHDISRRPIEAKRLIGYLPESGPLYQEMTVLEFLGFVAEIRSLSGSVRTAALDRVLDVCRLDEVRHQTIETLSKGFRQRVGMAQAVIHNPPYLIMDEPTDGLDPNQKLEVRKLIASMRQEKAIVLSTHILEEVEAMCNRVIIIARGKVIVDERPDGLLRRHPRYNAVRLSVRDIEEASVLDTLAAVPDIHRIERVAPGSFLVFPRDAAPVKETVWEIARERRWAVSELEGAPVKLEEVFSRLTGKHGEALEVPAEPEGGDSGSDAEQGALTAS